MSFLQEPLPVLIRVKAGSPLGIPELPVRLLNTDGTPAVGVTPLQLIGQQVTFVMADGAILSFVMNGFAAAWKPAGAGFVLESPGLYHIILSPAVANLLFSRAKAGRFQYYVLPVPPLET